MHRFMCDAEAYELWVKGWGVAEILRTLHYRGAKGISRQWLTARIQAYAESIASGQEHSRTKYLHRLELMTVKLLNSKKFDPQHAQAVVALSREAFIVEGWPLAKALGGAQGAYIALGYPNQAALPTGNLPPGEQPMEGYLRTWKDSNDLKAAAGLIATEAEFTEIEE